MLPTKIVSPRSLSTILLMNLKLSAQIDESLVNWIVQGLSLVTLFGLRMFSRLPSKLGRDVSISFDTRPKEVEEKVWMNTWRLRVRG